MGLRIPTPIPYQGSKRKLAPQILRCIPPIPGTLYEPFAGSAAVSLGAIATRRASAVFISDVLAPLMDIWRMILDHPTTLATRYESLWLSQLVDPRGTYDQIRAEFNRAPEAAKLLYLIARCVKNSIRFNPRGEFNQSPDNRRIGMRPTKMRREILGAHSLLTGRATIRCLDYREALRLPSPEDLVYMDPPYQGVSDGRDRRYVQPLDVADFVGELERLNSRGICYLVSFDGICGERRYGADLPAELGLERRMLVAGRSTQSTLLGKNEITVEALYLSPALAKKLSSDTSSQAPFSLLQPAAVS